MSTIVQFVRAQLNVRVARSISPACKTFFSLLVICIFFMYSPNGYSQSITLLGSDITGESTGDFFGYSVSLSSDGSRLAVGAIYNDGAGPDAGHARVYAWNTGNSTWEQLGSDIDGGSNYDQFGASVSLSSDGSRLAVGANVSDLNGVSSGQVRIYEWDAVNTTWDQIGADIDGEAAGDRSGVCVSLSSDGSRVAIGAFYNSGSHAEAGQVRIYEWDAVNTTWDQVGADIDGEAAYDQSGFAVSLSADGDRVAIGAAKNDGSHTDAGHVRIYDWNGFGWIQVDSDIDGEAGGDESGSYISLSSDGTRVAIGAPLSDDNGVNSGHVRVYSLPARILPVTYMAFTGRAAESHNLLHWATGSEENNEGFQVERSANGRDFEAIGWVAGAGTTLATSHYTFTDEAPLSGVNYYRLAQMDYDGTTTYSPIATTVCKSSGKAFDASQVAIYPNPADAHLTIDLPLTGVESLAIRNVLGQAVYTQHSPQGQQRLDISKWERGLYFMTLTSDQEQFSFRFIVR